MMSYCKVCGSQHDERADFCPECGAKIVGNTAGAISDRTVTQGTYQGTLPKKKGHRGTTIGVIAVIIVVIIFFARVLGSDDTGGRDIKADNEEEWTGNRMVDIYKMLQEYEGSPYTMSEGAESFLLEHEELFPASEGSDMYSFVDVNMEYKHIEKNIDKCSENLFIDFSMYVLTISEEYMGKGECITTLQVMDDDGNNFMIYILDEVPNVYEGDLVGVCGLPLGLTAFDNVGGGTTRAVVLAGCAVMLDSEGGI